MRAMYRFHRHRSHSLLMFLAVATMLLASLGEGVALAQPDTQAPLAQEAEDPGQPTEPVGEEPVVTEVPVEATEELVPPTEAATEQVAPTYQLTIDVFRCDHPDFDTGFSENLQRVINECTGPGSATFTVDSGNGQQEGTGNSLTFEIIGYLNLIESLPPGYDNPIANCFILDANGNTIDQIGPGEAGGGFWKVGGVQNAHCDWYQVDRGVGNVYLVNMACPSTTVLFPTPPLADLITACTEPAGAKQFFVVHSGGLERMNVSGGEFNDALFEAIPAGPIEIWMDEPAGFDKARVFCQVNTLEGVEIAPFAEVSVANFRATGVTLGHGQRLHCSWFNILQGPGLDLPDDPTATVSPSGNLSDLTIRLHTCPVGYVITDGADPITDCPTGPNGVNFTLTDTDPATVDLQTMTGDSVDSAVFFGGLAPGDYTVTETLPPNIPQDLNNIFELGCGGGGGIDPIPSLFLGTLTISMPPGIIKTCDWFNVPISDDLQPIARIASPEASPESIAAALVGTASLTLAAYACPAGFDVTTVDANPQALCAPLPGIGFEIDDSVDDNASSVLESGPSGVTETLLQVPADTYSIYAGANNGTIGSFYWDCYDAAGTSARTDPLKDGNNIQVEIADGAQVRCDWFAVTGGTGRVIINKHACDYLIPAYTLDLAGLAAQCTIDPGTIEFTVVSDIHQETQTASKSPLQLASFANVPSGYVAIVEKLPDGWAIPRVFCQVNLENGNPVSPPALMDVLVGRQINFSLEPGQVVYCDWYNVARGFVDVHLTKYACPPGFDAYAADLTTLVVTCTADPGMVAFSLEDGGLYNEERSATAAAPAVWEDVPSGKIRVNETLPDGYGLPVVICRVDFEDGSNVLPAAPMPLAGSTWIWPELSAGQVLHCEWFNVPGGIGSVHIWKQACPAGLNVNALTNHELELACSEDSGTTEFSVTNGTFASKALSTNLFRYADFPAVPAGSLTVTETLPAGYGSPIVFCRTQSSSGPGIPDQKMTIEGESAITWQLESNHDLYCRWYNIVDTGSTVTIIKYTCPEGTAYDLDAGTYGTRCTTPHDGIEFKLTHTGGSSTQATAAGQVQWTGVPLGKFSIQEYIPPEYGEPVVFCGVVSSSGGPIDAVAKRVESPGGYIESEFTYPRTSYLCYWYNIPGGPGEVTIHKYTCPEGYDLYAAGADPKVDCTSKTNGITFTVGGPGDYQSQSNTGDILDGAVVFGDLDPGPYTVTETVPAGTRYVFVLDCYGQLMGELRPYPLAMGNVLTIEVGAGEKITCDWYNVPEYEGGRLTVYKYACSSVTWISDVDCEIDEFGKTFDLVVWDGDSWEYHSTGTTDGVGQYTWVDLAPGEYWLDEHDSDWCQMTSEQLSADGNWLNVADQQDTVVKVYNCSGEPGKPGKTPTKYPNTGVPPIDDRDHP